MKLPALDKIYHAVGCYTTVMTLVQVMPLLEASITTLVLWALKEWYDRNHPPHQAEWNDFWADCVGVGAAVAAVLLLRQIKEMLL